MRKRCLVLGFLGSLTACAATQTGAPVQSTATPPVHPPTPSAEAEDLRALPPEATFGDLVRAARNVDHAAMTRGEESCLLRGGASPRLAADLLLSLKPLPDAPEKFADLLEGDPGTPTVLTAWERVPGNGTLALAAFTTTTAAAVRGRPVVLAVTQRGTYVRSLVTAPAQPGGPLPNDAVGGWLAQASAAETASVYVTAEAQVPVTTLSALLLSIPDRFEVALAVMLPKGTQLPAAAAPSEEVLCPDGLPEPAESEPEGDVDGVALRTALEPLRDAALACALSTGGRAALGGRLVLALRVGADGRTAHACFIEDDIQEPMLRRCLASSAHSLPLPTPSPAGFVDVALPLHIDLSGLSKQRAVCE